MEFEHYQKIALIGFLGAAVFGAIASRTHFCTMGAISDWVNMGSRTRFKVWVLAIGVAVLGAQAMHLSGMIDLNQSIYRTANFTWLGYVLGGLCFGIGMTLASGCGQRTLVRLGGGNLKSLVVFIVMGLTAYMTLRGILALIRLQINDVTTIDLTEKGLASQNLAEWIGQWLSINPATVGWVLAILIGGGAVLYALKDKEVRGGFDNLLAGLGIGLIIVGAWYTTGVLGFDDFEPLPLEGFTFIAPVGNSISYLMTYTGATINFGIAVVFGMIAGAFVYSILAGTFRIESFNDSSDLINHLIGAVFMGFGGVLALGCTIGQGVSGISTLAVGSLMALVSIIAGCALTLKMQYYLYDEEGWMHAAKSTLKDCLPSRSK